MKTLTFTGEYAHLNRFQFQLSQVEKRKYIITEPLTGLRVAGGRTEQEAIQRLYAVSKGVDLDSIIQEHLRCEAITQWTWMEINKLYGNGEISTSNSRSPQNRISEAMETGAMVS